jgi:hypothetical protein
MIYGRLTRATQLRSALLIGSVLLGLGLTVSAASIRPPATTGARPGPHPAPVIDFPDPSSPVASETPTPPASPTDTATPTAPVSPTAPVTPPIPRPGAPTGLTAVAGNAEAQLCWHAAARATAYVLSYQDITVAGAWTRMPYPVTATCFTVQLLWNSHHYQFRVRGGNGTGEGPDSTAVDVTPQAPLPAQVTGLTATSTVSGQASLCWQAAANADGYAIDFHDVTKAQDWTTMPYPVNDTCFTISLLVGGDRYEFRVRGGNLVGPGPNSTPVSVTVHI